MAAPSGKFKFRANAPSFVPKSVQDEGNKRRNQALGVAMIHEPTLIRNLGPTSKALNPSYNPNIQASLIYLKGPDYIIGIVDTYNMYPLIVPFHPNVLDNIERILCKEARIPPDYFAEIFNRLIQTKRADVVRRLLKCDTLVRTAREHYRQAESFDRNAATLYHYLDDSMLDIAERLYEIGIDINYVSDPKPGIYTIGADHIPNYTPLEQAIINIQPELVKFFLEKGATLPTNPDSLFRAIYPSDTTFVHERMLLSESNPNYIQELKSKIEEIYNLVPRLKETINVLIITSNIPGQPIEKKTILTRLIRLIRLRVFERDPSYQEMINYFINKLRADGAIEGSEIEQRGASRKRKQSRRRLKSKRSHSTRRLK